MNKADLIKQLQTWYTETPGKQLASFESYYMSHSLHKLFGSHLLHLGDIGTQDWLEGSAARYSVCLTESGVGVSWMPIIQGTYDNLPIQESSIDIVLLPHILEFEENPCQVLAEVSRILVPHGHAIILGFNPMSLFGASRAFHQHFQAMSQIRHWLNSEEFDIVDTQTFFFRPAMRNETWLAKLRFLEILGQFFWSSGGGVYLFVAKKKVIGMTPVRPAWRDWLAKPVPLVVRTTS
jgi:SAM-dependent methyltransferase